MWVEGRGGRLIFPLLRDLYVSIELLCCSCGKEEEKITPHGIGLKILIAALLSTPSMPFHIKMEWAEHNFVLERVHGNF